MSNRGYCKNCWWWKRKTGSSTDTNIIMDNLGKCYFQSMESCEHYTIENSYCPDYSNRKKEDKKQTLDDWIFLNNIK